MSEDDDFLRQTRLARMMAQTEEADEGASVADLRLARRMAAMQDDSDEDDTPAHDDALMSEGTKQALKKAGALAAIAGKWGAGKAKEGALLAAEKARAAKAAADRALVERDAKRTAIKQAQAAAATQEFPEVAAKVPKPDAHNFEAATGALVNENHAQSAPAVAVGGYQDEETLGDFLARTKAIETPAGTGQEQPSAIRPTKIAAAQKSRKSTKTLALVVGSVVLLAAAGGTAFWWSQQQKPAPAAVPTVAKPAPVVVPVPVPTPVVQPTPVEVIAPVPAPIAVEPMPVLVEPEPVAIEPGPVAEPKPVAKVDPAPVIKQTPKSVAVKKKPVPAPIAKPKPVAPKESWQDKAQDDMAAFEKEMGIE